MNRQTFIRSLAGVAALQAIPASVLAMDINPIPNEISYDECLQWTVPIKFGDVLISPDGEAYQVINVMEHDVHARVIDGEAEAMFTHDQAQEMICHDWDDLDTELNGANRL